MIIIKIMTIAMIIMIRSSPVSLISISPATPTCAAVLWAVSTLQHDHGYDGHDLEDNGCSIKIPHSAYDDDEDAKVMIKCVVVGS